MNEGNRLRTEIEKLIQAAQQKKSELSILERNCRHKYGASIYDPEKTQKFIFTHYEGAGSDPWPAGYYVPDKKDRWSRTCELCGRKEYTFKQRPSKYEPDFSDR